MPRKSKEQLEKEMTEKKDKKVSNICLAIIAIFLTVFTAIVLIIFSRTGCEPSTLITSVFAACTGELGFMALIKNSKHKYKIDDDDDGGPAG